MNILVIDDDPSYLCLFEAFCESTNNNFYSLNNGRNAVTVALREHINLVVLDIFMDNQNGLDTLEKLVLYTDIPVLTISSDLYYLKLSKKLGAKYSLEKPISYDMFKGVLVEESRGRDYS